jgi:hypothetical protein
MGRGRTEPVQFDIQEDGAVPSDQLAHEVRSLSGEIAVESQIGPDVARFLKGAHDILT